MTPMDADDDDQRPTTAVVLAAGAGTRMRSRLPKVLHPLAGRPMLLHVLHAVRAAGIPRAVVVTGIDEEQVRAGVSSDDVEGLDITFAHQAEPRGTGNALLQAREVVTGERVVVVNGDLGLLTGTHLRALVAATPCRAAVATITVADPAGLGRVVRDGAGRLTAIVEEVETSAETARIDEVCAGLYRFETAWLWPALAALPAGASGEIYLTDAIARAAVEPGGALAVPIDAADGPLNVEDRQDLARAERVLRARLRTAWMRGGVTIVDPATTYIDADVHIEPDTVLEPGTHLRGRTVVGGGSRLGPNAVLRDAVVGANCVLEQCSVTDAILGDGVTVGPYSTLRAGTVLDDGVHIGTHAETKNAHLHAGVTMGHFSYLGDAEVGAGTNIGAGAITCNYDGTAKHRTLIGERVFIGSDSLLIAPLAIGDDARTGAGAVVTRDVPARRRVVGHPARNDPARTDRPRDRPAP